MSRKTVSMPRRTGSDHRSSNSSVYADLLSRAADALRAGRLDEAQQFCLRILDADMHNPGALHFLGLIEHQLGRSDRAVELISQAIQVAPESDQYYSNLGVVLRALGRTLDAVEAFAKATSLNPHSAEAQNNLGLVCLDQNKLAEAESAFRRAINLRPSSPESLNNLGLTRLRQGNPDEAEQLFARALALNPSMAEAQNNLGKVHLEQGKYADSEACFRRALTINPGYAEAHNNLGLALLRQDLQHPHPAMESFRRALALKPDFVEAHTNLGYVYAALNQPVEARTHLERALALQPASADARWQLALIDLRKGNFAAGWRNYEARYRIRKLAPRPFPQPLWQGQPLDGARILIHAEQGLGDTIQFLRYLPMVKEAGGVVVLDVPANLARIAQQLPDVFELSTSGSLSSTCRWQCPLLSLPLAFATRLDSIPAQVPYLSIPEEAREKAAALDWPSGGLRVGIAWTGNPAHSENALRSIDPLLLQPLLGLKHIHFYSLQIGASLAEVLRFNPGIVDLTNSIGDMADTAAIIEHLDLVISVDTSVVHLAGALAKPCWVVLPFVPDWRWMMDRDDSPWYPTLRLYRQSRRGQWGSVIEQVTNDLSLAAEGDRNLLSPAGAAVPVSSPPVYQPASPLNPSSDRILAALATRAATFVPAGARVLDFSADATILERFLPDACCYVPCSLAPCNPRVLRCDPDAGIYPDEQAASADIVCALGVLEQLQRPAEFFNHLRQWRLPLVVSCRASQAAGGLDWAADPSCAMLIRLAGSAGFAVQCSDKVDSRHWLFRLSPLAQSVPTAKRVGVLSLRNTGNFGDRLGFHLLTQILPPHAEVTHFRLGSGEVPDADFDLMLVGMGNSIFGHYLDASLMRLLDRARAAIGIFGTQYHDSMPVTALDALLDQLDHWYARNQEDLLRYGRGRSNASHLGDWLIQAFPMARPGKTERLDIGDEIWNELPLDRTIHAIQQHATVFSTRIHPLLCALTSADRVAYREQRESGSGAVSGKFRSMLLDIFGRDFPEEQFFAVDRAQVLRYKIEVESRVAQLRDHIGRILSAD